MIKLLVRNADLINLINIQTEIISLCEMLRQMYIYFKVDKYMFSCTKEKENEL